MQSLNAEQFLTACIYLSPQWRIPPHCLTIQLTAPNGRSPAVCTYQACEYPALSSDVSLPFIPLVTLSQQAARKDMCHAVHLQHRGTT